MKIITTLLAFLYLIAPLTADENDIRNDFPSTSLVNTDNLVSTLIEGKVSAISGDYIEYSADIVIDGPEPIALSRFYSDKSKAAFEIGCSWDFAMPYLASVDKNHRNNCSQTRSYWANIRESTGGIFKYAESFKGSDEASQVTLKPDFPTTVTNCGMGRPSGKTNVLNSSLKLNKFCGSFTFKEGDGNLRHYSKKGTDCVGTYFLRSEEKPNGSQLLYTYHDNLPKKIEGKDASRKCTYGSIQIEKNHKIISAEGSNVSVKRAHLTNQRDLTGFPLVR